LIRSKGNVLARKDFDALEKKYDKIQSRLLEMTHFCESPSHPNTPKNITHQLFIWTKPILLACTLVFIPRSYPLPQMLVVFLIQHIYLFLVGKIGAFDERARVYFVCEFALMVFFHYL